MFCVLYIYRLYCAVYGVQYVIYIDCIVQCMVSSMLYIYIYIDCIVRCMVSSMLYIYIDCIVQCMVSSMLYIYI